MSATVLVVDDEPMVLRVCRRVLEHEGHRVLTARDADQAVEVLQNSGNCIDVLLCDVVMPGVRGGELANVLRELQRGLDVIFISGHVDDPEAQIQIDEGRARFLGKPFVINELLGMVAEFSSDGI